MSMCTYIIRKKDSKEIYHHCRRGKVLLFYLFGDYYVCLYMIYGNGFEWTISCYYCILKTDTSNILMHKQKSTWAIVKTWWVHSAFPSVPPVDWGLVDSEAHADGWENFHSDPQVCHHGSLGWVMTWQGLVFQGWVWCVKMSQYLGFEASPW